MMANGKARARRSSLGAAIALSFALARQAFGVPAEPIREVWQRPVGSAQSLAISPDGSRCALVTWKGEVLCWAGGRLCWRRSAPGAEEVLLGADGRAVIYTPLDLLRRDLLVLDGRGKTTGRITIGGPISTVALSADGRTAAVGTADGGIEIHGLTGSAPAVRATLRGAVQQLGSDGGGGWVAATTGPAWLVSLSQAGKIRWRHPAPPGCEFRLGSPARGAGAGALTVAAIVPTDASDPSDPSDPSDAGSGTDPNRLEIEAFAGNGKPVWRQPLLGRDPHVGVMAASGQVIVAYERAHRRGLVVRYDRTLACFAGNGAPRWQHGDMVYEPLLVCASPRGDTILSLCTGDRFWLLSSSGQNLWSYTASAPVRMARASADGSSVAVATADGHLLLLRISTNGHL